MENKRTANQPFSLPRQELDDLRSMISISSLFTLPTEIEEKVANMHRPIQTLTGFNCCLNFLEEIYPRIMRGEKLKPKKIAQIAENFRLKSADEDPEDFDIKNPFDVIDIAKTLTLSLGIIYLSKNDEEMIEVTNKVNKILTKTTKKLR